MFKKGCNHSLKNISIKMTIRVIQTVTIESDQTDDGGRGQTYHNIINILASKRAMGYNSQIWPQKS